MQVGMSGGDLEGGRDQSRNAQVTNLKKLFYSKSRVGDQVASDEQDQFGKSLGYFRDIPIARFRMPALLPHQQVAFNIFQPALVHLFESLLATEKPWVYMHTHLPGGVDSLGDPQYALPGLGISLGAESDAAGENAVLMGTLMQVVAVERQSDARIVLISQGISRAVVTHGTQALPYARGDVMTLHDAEAMEAAARLARRELSRRTIDGDCGVHLRRSILAAAIAEDRSWGAYEYAPVELGRSLPASFATFAGDKALSACAARTPAALMDSVAAAMAADDAPGEGTEVTTAIEACDAAQAALTAALLSTEGMEASLALTLTAGQADAVEVAEQMEADAVLGAAEQQLWLELDALFRALAERREQNRLPPHIMALLPPPPAGGWPEEFILDTRAAEQRAQAESEREMAMFNPNLADDFHSGPMYQACDWTSYPARRRAQRLSFALWPWMSDAQQELQAALEATSTADRLRMATLKVRKVRKQIARSG